ADAGLEAANRHKRIVHSSAKCAMNSCLVSLAKPILDISSAKRIANAFRGVYRWTDRGTDPVAQPHPCMNSSWHIGGRNERLHALRPGMRRSSGRRGHWRAKGFWQRYKSYR